jgi:nicotinamidase-related amidase
VPIIHVDLHGNAPDKSGAALLLIDFINDLEFEEGEAILDVALPAARKVLALKQRARNSKIPVIYVNDNFGRWRSDFAAQVRHCLEDNVRGRPIAELLQPDEEDYFVLKPKHSGFYSTCMEVLLSHLQVRRLILTGLAGNNCVLFTASDAYLRDFQLFIPADCVCSNTRRENSLALAHMQKVFKADTRPSAELDLAALGQH